MKNPKPIAITIEDIIAGVTMATDIPRDVLMSKSRKPRTVLARSAAWYLAKKMTVASYPDIAAAFGRPTHSTIVEGVKRVHDQIDAGHAVEGFGALDGSMGSFVEFLRVAAVDVNETN